MKKAKKQTSSTPSAAGPRHVDLDARELRYRDFCNATVLQLRAIRSALDRLERDLIAIAKEGVAGAISLRLKLGEGDRVRFDGGTEDHPIPTSCDVFPAGVELLQT